MGRLNFTANKQIGQIQQKIEQPKKCLEPPKCCVYFEKKKEWFTGTRLDILFVCLFFGCKRQKEKAPSICLLHASFLSMQHILTPNSSHIDAWSGPFGITF